MTILMKKTNSRMSTRVKELADEGLYTLRGTARTRKAGYVSVMATHLEGGSKRSQI